MSTEHISIDDHETNSNTKISRENEFKRDLLSLDGVELAQIAIRFGTSEHVISTWISHIGRDSVNVENRRLRVHISKQEWEQRLPTELGNKNKKQVYKRPKKKAVERKSVSYQETFLSDEAIIERMVSQGSVGGYTITD